jgi:hypothetical protein
VRMSLRGIAAAAILAGVWLAIGSVRICAAQDGQFLMPDESAAKAKEILQSAIAALGGSTYLNYHDETCTYRLGNFDHSGQLTGFGKDIDYSIPPTKDRTELLPKRNQITIFNGDKGWVLDRGGVSDAPASDLVEFQANTAMDLDNILHNRLQEPGMVFRYAGPDIVDLSQADWVELVDSENRTYRIAIATGTHLPLRETVEIRDPRTQMKSEELFIFSNYHTTDGIETAFQITHTRNGMKIYQAFVDTCQYNTNLPESLFTKESLDERWEKIGKKERAKEKKQEEKDEKNDSSSDKD